MLSKTFAIACRRGMVLYNILKMFHKTSLESDKVSFLDNSIDNVVLELTTFLDIHKPMNVTDEKTYQQTKYT